MKNLTKYIKKYGNLTFEEKSFNEIDVLIFSLISYIDFKGILKGDKKIKLHDAWIVASKTNTKPFGFSQASAIKVMKNIYDKNRYSDLILKDYVYYVSNDSQFGAITIDTPQCTYVSFEGTDDEISGWKEDFELFYVYPTKSQKMAIEYLNSSLKKHRKVIVCGHSKGGNLSLVSAINISFLKKRKIKKIYSFDGPGLRKEEFNSFDYRLVRKKLVNIIPNSSFIGIVLNQENLRVVKSKGIGPFQHDPMTWIIEDDRFKYTEQDKISKKLSNSIDEWVSKNDDNKKREIVEILFKLLEDANIKKVTDIKSNKIKFIYNVVKNTKNMSNENKEVLITSAKFLVSSFKDKSKCDEL